MYDSLQPFATFPALAANLEAEACIFFMHAQKNFWVFHFFLWTNTRSWPRFTRYWNRLQTSCTITAVFVIHKRGPRAFVRQRFFHGLLWSVLSTFNGNEIKDAENTLLFRNHMVHKISEVQKQQLRVTSIFVIEAAADSLSGHK